MDKCVDNFNVFVDNFLILSFFFIYFWGKKEIIKYYSNANYTYTLVSLKRLKEKE